MPPRQPRTSRIRPRLAAFDDANYVRVSELTSAVDDGAVVEQERVTGRVKFRRSWFARHRILDRNRRAIQVSGESMEPTLVDGWSILVNLAARLQRTGRIFVIRTGDGLVVKGAARDPSGACQIVSANPNKQVWPTRPWPRDAKNVGELRWTARTFL